VIIKARLHYNESIKCAICSKSGLHEKEVEMDNDSTSTRNASGTGGSRASRRAELSSLLSANSSSKGLGEDGRDSPLAASSEDLSTRSGSPRYNSTFNDDSQTK